MPGLVPGIHDLLPLAKKDVDGRDKPGHDEKADEVGDCFPSAIAAKPLLQDEAEKIARKKFQAKSHSRCCLAATRWKHSPVSRTIACDALGRGCCVR
jgi:hypothetical protein